MTVQVVEFSNIWLTILREIFKDPPILSYGKGRSLKDILVRAKLWRSTTTTMNQWESCLACLFYEPSLRGQAAFERNRDISRNDSGRFQFTKRFRKIPENSGNFIGKFLSAKDVFHLTHSFHSSQAPFTVRCISRQNTKWWHNCCCWMKC